MVGGKWKQMFSVSPLAVQHDVQVSSSSTQPDNVAAGFHYCHASHTTQVIFLCYPVKLPAGLLYVF